MIITKEIAYDIFYLSFRDEQELKRQYNESSKFYFIRE